MGKSTAIERVFELACVVCLLALLPSCGLFGSSRPHLPRPVFSPNGEPLVGAGWPAHCADALDLWFDRVDTSHDGKMTLVEMETDAVRQFKVMDLRRDGKVTAAEIATYREKAMGGRYASYSTPEIAIRQRYHDEEADGGDRRRHEDESMPQADASGVMPADKPDPVMSADTDLDGSVTLDEFKVFVHQNFADFDKDHAGYITKDDLHTACRGED